MKSGTAPAHIRRVVHGTTLATNTILEHKGGRVAFVTTLGFRHLLALGRHARVEILSASTWLSSFHRPRSSLH